MPAQPARRARAADRGDGRGRGLVARRARGRRPAGVAVLRARRRDAARGARHARRAATRARSSPSCGPGSCGTACATCSAGGPGALRLAVTSGGTIPDRGLYGVFLAERRDDERRPGRRRAHGRHGARRQARRRARRGDGLRVARRRHVHARVEHVADRRHHPGPRAGHARARASRAGCRSGRATPRAGPPSSAGRWGPGSASSARCPTTTPARASRRPGSTRGRPTTCCTYLREQREATGEVPDRHHARGRAVPRRARRLAGRPALAVRRARARPVGDRHRRPAARAVRRRRGGDALRRRDRAAPARHAGRGAGRGARRRRPLGRAPARRSTWRDLLLDPDEVLDSVRAELGWSAMFGARFREAASRALLLPRRRPDRRQPLWQQRQRSAQLLSRRGRSTPTSRSCSRRSASASRTTSTPRRSPRSCGTSRRARSGSSR